MKTTKTYVNLLGIALILVGCTTATSHVEDALQPHTIPIDVEQVDFLPYDSLVRNIEFIPLETNEYSMLGEIVDAVFDKELIVVNSRSQPVCCFDERGKFKFRLGNVGVGPDEYREINGISVEDGIIYLYDSTVGALLLFDAGTGRFMRRIKCSDIYAKAYVLDGYVYASTCVDVYRLVSFPLASPAEVSELYQSKEKLLVSYKLRKKITRSDGRLFWTNPLWGEVYELKDGRMTPFVVLDFADKALPKEDSSHLKELVKKRGYAFQVGDFLMADSLLHLTYHFSGTPMSCWYNLSLQKICQLDLLEYLRRLKGGQYHKVQKMPFVTYESDGWFYQFLHPFKGYSSEENLSPKYKTYERLQHMNSDSNPYLVRFQFGL